MAHSSGTPDAAVVVPTVDLSAFANPASSSPEDRLAAGRALVAACHRFGLAKVKGHGIAQAELDDAFSWVKRLFDLPLDDKMKAPHPAAPMPHRGYSGLGLEKVYSKAEIDMDSQARSGDVEKGLRKISDFKVRPPSAFPS